MTSSSEVWVKWRYPCPTAKKNAGVLRQTTSSAYPVNLSTMSCGPIGTANTTLLGAVGAGNLACRLGSRSGGDAVVDNQGYPPRQRDSVTAAAKTLRAASEFDSLLAFDRVHVVIVELCRAHYCVVEHPHAVLADGAEGQFGLKRHTELAHDKDVELGPQCFGDLKRHRHAAAWQAENGDVLTTERLQTLRHLAPSVQTIVKQSHHPSVTRCDGKPIWD